MRKLWHSLSPHYAHSTDSNYCLYKWFRRPISGRKAVCISLCWPWSTTSTTTTKSPFCHQCPTVLFFFFFSNLLCETKFTKSHLKVCSNVLEKRYLLWLKRVRNKWSYNNREGKLEEQNFLQQISMQSYILTCSRCEGNDFASSSLSAETQP